MLENFEKNESIEKREAEPVYSPVTGEKWHYSSLQSEAERIYKSLTEDPENQGLRYAYADAFHTQSSLLGEYGDRERRKGNLDGALEYMKDAVLYEEQAAENSSAKINEYGGSDKFFSLKNLAIGSYFGGGSYKKMADISKEAGDTASEKIYIERAVAALNAIMNESVRSNEAGEIEFANKMTIDPSHIFETALLKFDIDTDNPRRYAEMAERIRQARDLNEKARNIWRGIERSEESRANYRDVYAIKLAELYLEMPPEQFTEEDLKDLETMQKKPDAALLKEYHSQIFFAKLKEVKKARAEEGQL